MVLDLAIQLKSISDAESVSIYVISSVKQLPSNDHKYGNRSNSQDQQTKLKLREWLASLTSKLIFT